MIPQPECPCGCRKRGAITRAGHSRGCRCPSCTGRRNRQKGQHKQRLAAKATGGTGTRFHGQGANEESWRTYWRREVKSGKSDVGRILVNKYLKAEAQSEQARSFGDTRPFAFVAMPEGWGSEGLVTVRLSTWRDHIAPLFALGEPTKDTYRYDIAKQLREIADGLERSA